ncbi:hypothetical protein DLM77_09465 [Leptospira yasudae]|uniref:Uncharacterized protein n=1 Tax=Leptospira yasudae TaxID=2202201 RepID=A0ABX9M3F3_9LEPT|nr:hypothetical protein DLM77_09465 [Leptospira yasudae]
MQNVRQTPLCQKKSGAIRKKRDIKCRNSIAFRNRKRNEEECGSSYVFTIQEEKEKEIPGVLVELKNRRLLPGTNGGSSHVPTRIQAMKTGVRWNRMSSHKNSGDESLCSVESYEFLQGLSRRIGWFMELEEFPQPEIGFLSEQTLINVNMAEKIRIFD